MDEEKKRHAAKLSLSLSLSLKRMVDGGRGNNAAGGKTRGSQRQRTKAVDKKNPFSLSRQKAQLLAVFLGQPDEALHLLGVDPDGFAKLFDDWGWLCVVREVRGG